MSFSSLSLSWKNGVSGERKKKEGQKRRKKDDLPKVMVPSSI